MTTITTNYLVQLLQDLADAYELGDRNEQMISYLVRCILIANDNGQLDALEAHVGVLCDKWLEDSTGNAPPRMGVLDGHVGVNERPTRQLSELPEMDSDTAPLAAQHIGVGDLVYWWLHDVWIGQDKYAVICKVIELVDVEGILGAKIEDGNGTVKFAQVDKLRKVMSIAALSTDALEAAQAMPEGGTE